MNDEYVTREEFEAFREELREERKKRKEAERENEQKDERIENLERALAEHQRDAEKWREDHEQRHEAKSNWMENLDERVCDLEEREIDVSTSEMMNASPASNVPIQQMYDTVNAGFGDELTKNQVLAARVWPYFEEAADPSGGRLRLTSTKVQWILEEKLNKYGVDATTTKRIMEFISRCGEKGGQEIDPTERFISFYTQSNSGVGTNYLEVDQDEWDEVIGEMMDEYRQNAAESRSVNARTTGGATAD